MWALAMHVVIFSTKRHNSLNELKITIEMCSLPDREPFSYSFPSATWYSLEFWLYCECLNRISFNENINQRHKYEQNKNIF